LVEEEAGAFMELNWGFRIALSALIPAEPTIWFMVELREREPPGGGGCWRCGGLTEESEELF
jgi:hypothetical protein